MNLNDERTKLQKEYNQLVYLIADKYVKNEACNDLITEVKKLQKEMFKLDIEKEANKIISIKELSENKKVAA